MASTFFDISFIKYQSTKDSTSKYFCHPFSESLKFSENKVAFRHKNMYFKHPTTQMSVGCFS